MKRIISYTLAYLGGLTIAILFSLYEISKLPPIGEGAISPELAIWAFNIGGWLLFILAGTMREDYPEGHKYILGIAVTIRLWMFLHVGLIFGFWENIMFELWVLNMGMIAFEAGAFLLSHGHKARARKEETEKNKTIDQLGKQLTEKTQKVRELNSIISALRKAEKARTRPIAPPALAEPKTEVNGQHKQAIEPVVTSHPDKARWDNMSSLEQAQYIIALRKAEEGISNSEIARRVGVAPNTIGNRLKAHKKELNITVV